MAADEDAAGRFRIAETQEQEGGQAMSQSFRAVKEIRMYTRPASLNRRS